MLLRCVCRAGSAVINAPLPLHRAMDDRLALCRREASRGLNIRWHASERVAGVSTGTASFLTSLRGGRSLTMRPGRRTLKPGCFGLKNLCGSWRYSCGNSPAVSSLVDTVRCSRSSSASFCVPSVALETPRRCYMAPTGIARGPSSSSHSSHTLSSSHGKNCRPDSLPPSPPRYKRKAQPHMRRSPTHAARNRKLHRAQDVEPLPLRTPDDPYHHGIPPVQSEATPTEDHANHAYVAEDGEVASTAADAALPSAAAQDVPAGWGLEEVNSCTGRTKLEELYERSLDRIRDILEQPLPAMPQDGSVDPDVFVGFASYSYQLRDQYRAILARELQVPVKAVRLSVAWSGRFDVRRFGRVQKVCGVCLDRQVLQAATHSEGENPCGEPGRKVCDSAANMRSSETSSPSSASAPPLSEALQTRIHTLVTAINARRREDLLQMSFFQASLPIPEVEFALNRREHRLVYHLHEWIRRRILQRAVVVVVYGVPPPPPTTATTATWSASAAPPPSTGSSERQTVTSGTADIQNGEPIKLDQYTQWQRFCRMHTAAQKREVQDKWLRLFHRRKVVPSMMSLTELATEAAVALVRGEVPHIGCEQAKAGAIEVGQSGERCTASQDASSMNAATSTALLDPNLEAVLVCIAAASSSPLSPTVEEGGASAYGREEPAALLRRIPDVFVSLDAADPAKAAPTTTPRFRPTSTSQKESSMRWVRLVYQALLLREAQGSTDRCSSSSSSSSSRSSADAEPLAMRVSQHVSLPALFAQGAYAGGQEEMAYLQRNPAAMDALLLHPHEVSYKKKFFSRMRNGHRRLRMEEESASPYPMNG